jgi:hypothetical protein
MSESIADLRWPPIVTARGIAGLAVRIGRSLEDWGERAAKPAALAELERRREIQAGSQRDRAAHEQALRGGYRGL